MPRHVRIAICQFASEQPAEGSVQSNFKRLESFISSAASDNANLIVFPEYFLTGIISEHLHLASEEGDWIQELKLLAKHYKIDVVAGTVVEKSAKNAEHLFNTARYIDKNGNVLGEYQKKHLWHPEKEYLQNATEEHQVFNTDLFKAGLLICWDMAWPEAFRALLRQGVEVVIVPAYWTVDEVISDHDPVGTAEKAWLDSLLITRAYENECCVIFVNCAGPKEQGFLGRSGVALPFKGAVAHIESCNEMMKLVDVDLDILEHARKAYKIKEDLETYYPER
ncbi:hypothetical protein Clacol_004734 [Clathrus columnatus]|uniref:CN hydrolase domain-containing protein n=1 Tax=Clathrus columnatus TaxID=1419009 RepID=A0AAV5ABG3_9AGAM|nr:hypothetical protein Clacol_004734 [Clathrus columnatus]